MRCLRSFYSRTSRSNKSMEAILREALRELGKEALALNLDLVDSNTDVTWICLMYNSEDDPFFSVWKHFFLLSIVISQSLVPEEGNIQVFRVSNDHLHSYSYKLYCIVLYCIVKKSIVEDFSCVYTMYNLSYYHTVCLHVQQECIPVGFVPTTAVVATRCQ